MYGNSTNESTSVAYGNGTYVALGDYSPFIGGAATTATQVSTNGTTWAAGGALPTSAAWTSVTYGNGMFVAVAYGTTSAAYSTNNGATWTLAAMAASGNWSTVTYGNGTFVASQYAASAGEYSTNGTTWTAMTLPASSNRYMALTYGNGYFVAASYGSTISAYSANGISWTTGGALPAASGWSSITYGNGMFVAVAYGSAGAAYSTNNGISWTASTLPSASQWLSVDYFNGDFVTNGYNTATSAYSATGTGTWSSLTLPSTVAWASEAAGPTLNVALSYNSVNGAALNVPTLLIATAPAAPAAPTVAIASATSIAVTWVAPASNGSPISLYTVTSTPGSFTCTSSSLTCTVTGLTQGTSYTFTVKATNALGAGSPSGSSLPIAPSVAPGAPTLLVATPSSTTVALSWTAPSSNGGSAITLYTATSTPGSFTCTSATTSCTINGLTNGTYYSFSVTATNVAGTGPASANFDTQMSALAPALWYKLADGSGSSTAADSSGNTDTGTVAAGVTFLQTGPIPGTSADTAGLFNGTSGKVTPTTPVTINLATQSMTLSAWIKTTNTSTVNMVIGDSNFNEGLVIQYGAVLGYYKGYGTPAGPSVADGNWHFVSVVYAGNGSNSRTIYVDGVAAYTDTSSPGGASPALPINTVGWSADGYFPGTIGQVSVIRSALTAAQEASLYATGSVNP
jgi:hypothetical protein